MAGELDHRARHLDPGRAAADDDGGEEPRLLGRVGGDLGVLEGEEQARPDGARVLDGARPRRRRGPVVMAEIVVVGPGGEDEAVEGKVRAVGEPDDRAPPCRRATTSPSTTSMFR